MSSDQERIRRRIRVHGRVQGVFFRDSTRERAESAGVAGQVSNEPDGSVEAVLEGPREAVETVIAFMREGPDRASVGHVEVSEETPEGVSGFEVR